MLFKQKFEESDLKTFRTQIKKFKDNQYEKGKPDNKELNYEFAMERIGVIKSEVEEFRAKENGFFKFGMDLFDTAPS